MDAFLSTYEENLKKEQDKIEQLEKDIVFALEHSSSNIDLDLSEIDTLKQKKVILQPMMKGRSQLKF